MISRHTYRDLTWVELEKPTHEEIRGLMEEFDIHPIVADELLTPSLRPRVDHYENFIYCILHFPAFRHTHERQNQEIDFLIGKKFLITVHYESIDPLHKFSKVFEVNSVLDKSNFGEHAGFLFFYMLRKVYGALLHELAVMQDDIKEVEDRIFNGEERSMVESLSRINRNLLTFRRALHLHGPILESLRIAAEEFFGKEFRHYIENIIGEYRKVENMLDDERETLDELRDTNNALLTTKTNESIKALTAINAVILPAALISWLFAVRAENMPIHGLPNDFWLIVAIMVAASLLTYTFLRLKHWI